MVGFKTTHYLRKTKQGFIRNNKNVIKYMCRDTYIYIKKVSVKMGCIPCAQGSCKEWQRQISQEEETEEGKKKNKAQTA